MIDMKKIGLLFVLGVMCSVAVFAQGNEPPMYNPNSVTPIAEYEQLYRKRVWRRMDLKEKQNLSFFAHSKEITKLIIEAVDRGEIFPYTNNDSLNVRMSKEQFFERLELEDYGGGNDDPFGLGEEEDTSSDDDGWGDSGDGWGDSGSSDDSADSGWGDEQSAEGGATQEKAPEYFLPTDVSVLEIMEDIIFDKRRSRRYYDIQSIKMIIPAQNYTTGLMNEVATFRYKDLEELFRNHPEEAIWFNPQNSAEHKNFADAFALRLQASRITKIQNPENYAIVEIYNNDEYRALLASQQLEFELMEYEHNLWSQ